MADALYPAWYARAIERGQPNRGSGVGADRGSDAGRDGDADRTADADPASNRPALPIAGPDTHAEPDLDEREHR